MGVAIIEICDHCGTRYQGPTLPPVASALQNAMRVISKHLPGPGETFFFACPKCTAADYLEISPLEREVWNRAERRAAGELLPDLDQADMALAKPTPARSS